MPMVRPKMTKEEIVIELTPQVHGRLNLAAIAPALSQLSSHGDTVCQDVLELCWPDLQALDPGEEDTWLHRLYIHRQITVFRMKPWVILPGRFVWMRRYISLCLTWCYLGRKKHSIHCWTCCAYRKTRYLPAEL